MSKIIWNLPLKTISEANTAEHWTTKSKRHKQQQFFVRALFRSLKTPINLPCCVKMIRLGPRYLDADDNLPGALKWIKDEISECLVGKKRKAYVTKKGSIVPIKGRQDDDPRIKWEYDQEKAKTLSIRIEIESLSDDEQAGIVHE